MKHLLYVILFPVFMSACCHCNVKDSPTLVKKTFLQENDGSKWLCESERYDSSGKSLEKVYYLGNGLTARIYRYFYDSLNRLVSMRGFIPERKDMPAVFSTYDYNKLGLKISSRSSGMSIGDTVDYTYVYNSRNLLIRTKATSNQKPGKNIIMWTGTEEFGYDMRDSLVSIWSTNSDGSDKHLTDSIFYTGNEKIHYRYDPFGNTSIKICIYHNGLLIKETENYQEVLYNYDKEKRLIRKEVTEFPGGSCIVTPNPQPHKRVYTYVYE